MAFWPMVDVLYHTSDLLRKHQLLVRQRGDKFDFVDWETYKPASEDRILKYEAEDESVSE